MIDLITIKHSLNIVIRFVSKSTAKASANTTLYAAHSYTRHSSRTFHSSKSGCLFLFYRLKEKEKS